MPVYWRVLYHALYHRAPVWWQRAVAVGNALSQSVGKLSDLNFTLYFHAIRNLLNVCPSLHVAAVCSCTALTYVKSIWSPFKYAAYSINTKADSASEEKEM